MPDYTVDPSPDEIAEAQAFLVFSALTDTAVWRSVSYIPDGRGGVTRTYVDTTISVWVRNPGAAPASNSKAPGESTYSWEFICLASAAIQPKDVIQYDDNDLEVVEITQHGSSAFSQLVLGKRVSA